MYYIYLLLWFLQPIALLHAAEGERISDTTKASNEHGDYGYWQSGQPDLMILWPDDEDNVVRRYLSPDGHAYRLWVDPDRGSGFPVGLRDEAMFRQFLTHIGRNDDKHWCELAETWSWSAAPPSTCGAHSYIQTGVCSIEAADQPCPDLCQPDTRTRVVEVDNGACEPAPPPPVCAVTAWTPARSTVCQGEALTQTRTGANCATESRAQTGSKYCPPVCAVTAWTPARSTVCQGETLTQTRTGANCATESRAQTGSKYCPPVCAVTAWTPARSTVCQGETLTQTRTGSNCATESRAVTGSKHCLSTCTPTNWSPKTRKHCKHILFQQSRRRSDCSYETRTVRGAKSGGCRGRCNHWKTRKNNKKCPYNIKHCGVGGGMSVQVNGVWRCCSYQSPCTLSTP